MPGAQTDGVREKLFALIFYDCVVLRGSGNSSLVINVSEYRN